MYGVTKWQIQDLDCIELYIELLILLNCELIDRCKPCKHFLGWVIETSEYKWDTIKYIEFDEALQKANNLKQYVTEFAIQKHFKQNRNQFNKMRMKFRKGRNSKNVIFKYKKIFVERDKKHIDFRNFIF